MVQLLHPYKTIGKTIALTEVNHSVMSNSLWPPWTIAWQAPLSMGILQARILEWVAMSSSRGSSQPRDWTQVSRIAGRFFTIWATKKPIALTIQIFVGKVISLLCNTLSRFVTVFLPRSKHLLISWLQTPLSNCKIFLQSASSILWGFFPS